MGIGLLLLAGVAYVAASLVQARAVRAARQQETWPELPPPAKMVICRTGPTRACAAEAARRTGLPVAWMRQPAGYRLQWLAALALPGQPEGRRFAFESLLSRDVFLQLDTQPRLPPQVDANLTGTYVVGGMEVHVYASIYSTSLTLTWFRFGTTYSLWVSPVHLLDQSALDPTTYVKLVSTIRFS